MNFTQISFRINAALRTGIIATFVVSYHAFADEPMVMDHSQHMAAPATTHNHDAATHNETMQDHTAMTHDHAGKAPPIGSLPSSDGTAPGDHDGMPMHMGDDPLLAKLQLDQFETAHSIGEGTNSVAWDGRFWLGRDLDKLWIRSEGDHGRGGVGEGDVESFWGHAIAPFWDVMLGMRHDLGDGPTRNWAALGVQGIAPYDFETEATFYVSSSGRSALRLKASQDWLFTQRLVLQPEFDLNAYARSDPDREIGAGISDLSLSLRLRYEISRKFAPYIGFNWVRKIGVTADYAHENNQSVADRQIIAGVRIWF
ncbi:MAG TPA: copper resistance protein B [Spongiibacteraceae bacterium]|nr:copper resistance protein B [Spongiibacteraceae bacterium]